MSETSSQPDIHPFFKVRHIQSKLKEIDIDSISLQDPSGRYVVLYSYSAQDENDLSVERGQCVTVLNSEDPDWFLYPNSTEVKDLCHLVSFIL